MSAVTLLEREISRIRKPYAVQVAEAEERMKADFLRAAAGPLHFTPAFLSGLDYWSGRSASMASVLVDALEYDDHLVRAVTLLCDMAADKEGAREDARELLDRMAAKFASQNAHHTVE